MAIGNDVSALKEASREWGRLQKEIAALQLAGASPSQLQKAKRAQLETLAKIPVIRNPDGVPVADVAYIVQEAKRRLGSAMSVAGGSTDLMGTCKSGPTELDAIADRAEKFADSGKPFDSDAVPL